MRIIFLSYNYSADIKSPDDWIKRIKFYIGWSEYLAQSHTVIRIDQINYTGNFTHNGIQYYCVNDGKRKNYIPRKLNRFVKDLHPDIVIVSSFLFPLQVVQLRFCLGKKVKIILQHHAEKPFNGLKRFLQKYASSKVNAFLFTSYETGNEWVKRNNLDNATKIHELLEVSSPFYSIERITAGKITRVTGSPVFIWVGRLNSNKDPVTVVKAFLKFTVVQPAAKLYMIYQTSELAFELERLLSKNPGISPVILVGSKNHDELLYWFNSVDFYISASHYEGSGTALCEAMSCGCIPVVSNIPSFRTIAGNSGLYFEPGNVEGLFSALKASIHLNSDFNKNNVFRIFKTELSFEAISDKFQRILEVL
jgi:glycosyltransferase involved in cell wall biosynthesis